MRRPTRVQVYDGLYRSQADERFEADAAEAARHGWRAVEGRWNGEQLAVTYVHEGPGWNRKQPRSEDFAPKGDAPGKPKAKRGRVRRYAGALVQGVVFVALLAAVIVSIFGVALIADVGDIRDMAQDLPKPIPKLVKEYLEWVKSIRG
ncbi:MAG: hypothetical protein ABWZ82_09810 [Candidatus Limnocylindrales bacterium]|jgi:hypothetical protein